MFLKVSWKVRVKSDIEVLETYIKANLVGDEYL